MYVKLISADDHKFFIKRETALASGTIKAMLSRALQRSAKVGALGNVNAAVKLVQK